jgi:hypothetical protein
LEQFSDYFSNFTKQLPANAARYLFSVAANLNFGLYVVLIFGVKSCPFYLPAKITPQIFFQLLAFRQPSAGCGKTDSGLQTLLRYVSFDKISRLLIRTQPFFGDVESESPDYGTGPSL